MTPVKLPPVDLVQDSPDIDISQNESVLNLIRSSLPKPPMPPSRVGIHKYRYRNGLDAVEQVENQWGGKRKNQVGRWKYKGKDYEQSPYVAAIKFVRSERVAKGLPAGAKEELESIEEAGVRSDLASSRRMDAKDKLHAVECKTIEEYLDTKTFTRKIANAMWAERVAHELVEWIDAPREDGKQPIKLTEFFREKGIYHRDFHRLSKQYEILAQAADYALRALGDIRERNVLENKWNPTAGMFMMGHYDEDWATEMRRREEAKQKQNVSQTIDLAAIVRETIKPVAPTEEVRVKLERDKIR